MFVMTSSSISYLIIVKGNTVEPLLYDHPQNHIGVVRIRGMVAREGFVYKHKALSVTRNVVV